MATKGRLSKADLDHRFNCLASFTQDPDSHLFFAPGMKWWLCNPHKRAKEDVVTVFEQVGATEVDMESAYGTRWVNKFASADEYPFSFFRVQKFSKAQYVTIEMTVENEYGSTTVVQ